jgi:hypothetical protein
MRRTRFLTGVAVLSVVLLSLASAKTSRAPSRKTASQTRKTGATTRSQWAGTTFGRTAAASGDPELAPAAPSHGLKFMPGVVSDPQNDLGEPSIRIDKKGNVYTCGPQGTTAAADRAQLSIDNGDTFRILGEPPTGRIAPGGGGDCEIEVAPQKNEDGNYNIYYAGLEALANFSVSRSTDEGRTFVGASTSAAVPSVDRQWMAASGAQTNYLFYNESPGGGTVQRSDDGGLTYQVASSPGNAAPDIGRPGPIVVDDVVARNPDGADNETLYGIVTSSAGTDVSLFRSTDRGQTFETFKIATAGGDPNSLFPVLAIDTSGNLYAAWAEKGSYNVYYSYSTDHGETWSKPKIVNRAGASSNLMPWIAAGDKGRIAIGFYCSSVEGGAEDASFRAPWYVCVNQSLNALSPHATFSQVRATSHPNHWDQVCTGGTGCLTGGDRTLYDFFTIRADPRDGRLWLVYTQSNKISGDTEGAISIDIVAKQKAGPSLFKKPGRVVPDKRRNVRKKATDRKGDALFDFSSFGPPDPARVNQPALDIRSLKLKPSKVEVDGKKVRALRAKLRLGDVSDAALTAALQGMQSQELMFVVRWFSGFQPDYLTASWRPGVGFTYGHGHMAQSASPKSEIYPAPGDAAIPGEVDPEGNTITMWFPYSEIQRIAIKDPAVEVAETAAKRRTRIWEVTAFTFGRPNPGGQGAGDLYNQADSTPSFDYKLR